MWRCMSLFKVFAIALGFAALAQADDAVIAKYLANAGVLITLGETKIVFDPLFDQDFGIYERVPKDISPERMLQLLIARPGLQLFGPSQAVDSMPVDPADADLRGRLHAVELDLEGTFTQVVGEIEVSAVRIPHSGWPTRHADIDNIAFRVSLGDAATVLHMGDALTDPAFFDERAGHWAERTLDLALPPYWFFLSNGGKKILDDHIHATEVIGVHVPGSMPDSPAQYPEEIRGRTLFSVPGEEKRIQIDGDAK